MFSFPLLSPRIAQYHDHEQTITFTTKPSNAAMAEVTKHDTNVHASYTIHPNILEGEEVPGEMKTSIKKTIRWLLQHKYVPVVQEEGFRFEPPQPEHSTSKWISAGILVAPGLASAPMIPLNTHTCAFGLMSEIQIWDIEKKECLETIKVKDAGRNLPDLFQVGGKTWLLYCSYDCDTHEYDKWTLWDPDANKLSVLSTTISISHCWCQIEEGKLLVGNQNYIGIWDLDRAEYSSFLQSTYDIEGERHHFFFGGDSAVEIGGIYAAQVLHDGNVAVGCMNWTTTDSFIKIVNIKSSECIQTLTGHKVPIFALKAFANGTLISSDREGVVKVWDVDKGHCLQTYQANPIEKGSTCQPKSDTFYVLKEGTIAIPDHAELQIYHPEKEGCLRSFEAPLEAHPIDMRQCNTGQVITLHSDHFIRVWDELGKCMHSFKGSRILKVSNNRYLTGQSLDEGVALLGSGLRLNHFEDHDAPLVQTIDLKNGRLLGVFNNHIKLWDVKTGKSVKNIPYTEGVISQAVALRNNTVVGVSGNRLLLWDLEMEKCLASVQVEEGPITHLILCKDDKVLIATSKYVKILDESLEKCLHIYRPPEKAALHSCTFYTLDDGKIVIGVKANDPNNIRHEVVEIWELDESKINIQRQYAHAVLKNVSKGGILFLETEKAYEVFDAKTDKCLRTIEKRVGPHRTNICSSALLEDDIFVLSTIKYDFPSPYNEPIVSFICYPSSVDLGVAVSIANPSVRAIAGSKSAILMKKEKRFSKLNDKSGRTMIDNFPNGWIMQLLADGRMVVLSDKNVLEVWDSDGGKHLHDLECEPREQWKIIENKEGNIIGTSDDHVIRVWDPETGRCVQTILGDISHILDSGEIIIQTHRDVIRMWDINTGRCLRELEGAEENIKAILEDGSIVMQSSSQKDEIETFVPFSQGDLGDLSAYFLKPIEHAIGHILATIKRDEPESNLSMICPLTQQLVIDPVVDNHGHTFERKAIEEHIVRCEKGDVPSSHSSKSRSVDSNEEPSEKEPWCPVSREPIVSLSPNLIVKGLADDMRAHPPIPIPPVLQEREIKEDRKKVKLYHTLAKELENENDLDQALFHYQQALKYTSRSEDYAPIAAILLKQGILKAALAHLYLAKLQIRENKLISTMNSLETAMQLYPLAELQEVLIAVNLSLFHDQDGAAKDFIRLAEDYLKQDRSQDAVRCYERACACQPDLLADCDSLLKLYTTSEQKANVFIQGILHFGTKDLVQATRLFERAIELKSPEVYLAYIHQLQSEEDDKKKYETYRLLANLYQELDDFPNYAATLQKIICWKIEADFAELSEALVSKSAYDRAEKVYSKWADSLLSHQKHDHLEKVVQIGLEKVGDSIPLLEHAYVLSEKNALRDMPEIAFRLGKAHEKKEYAEKAEQFYREALALDPSYAVANQLAHLLFKKDRKKESVQLYFEASERAYLRKDFSVIPDCFHQAKSMDPDLTTLNALERTAFATQYYVSEIFAKKA
ncbi:MAG: hypothetical protein K940chlam7_00536 [Chlamydiae bacterium]|nr:hypothetical protein [Chlamydiota bacterium]